MKSYKKKLKNDKNKLLLKLEKEELKIKSSYERFKEDKLSISRYKLQREVSITKIESFRKEVLRLDEEKQFAEKALRKSEDFVEKIYEANGFEKIPLELMESIFEKILVKDKDEIEFYLKLSKEEIKEVL